MRNKSNKILFFSRSIYPRSGGSSFVTESLAANFTQQEMAVVGEADFLSLKKIKRNPAGVQFYYIPSGLSFSGRGARFLKPLRWLFFPFALWQGCKIARKERATHVLGTFPEGFFVLLSLSVARVLHLPFDAYFHNTFVENRSGFNRWWANWIQNVVFRQARSVFVMSTGMKSYYEKHYPSVKKFKTLLHTFNRYPVLKPHVHSPPGLGLQLAFTGNFNESNMDATIRVVEALKKVPGAVLNFYTPVPKALLKLRGLDTAAIVHKGYLPEERYFDELAQNDIMVLTHGFEGGYSAVEYQTIFPTRVVKMMLTQRPIFAHVPATSFLHQYIRETQIAALADMRDEVAIRKCFIELAESREKQEFYIENGKRAVAAFFGPKVVMELKKQLFWA